MNDKQKEIADGITEVFVRALEALDLALAQLIKLSNELPKEEQLRTVKAMKLIIDHIEASVREVKFLLSPIPNESNKYTV